ncbi:hypothetical protein NDU88_005610 [Pleurodeles waltl]|uniref:Uncharacterized protein n=1 Tax=Pleurodeles waltl TaxID=8319 RepID=A0AAV7TW31_PLEWA|nr:hypothetical protein NDU88_005610 [Pleurodeles waltl]
MEPVVGRQKSRRAQGLPEFPRRSGEKRWGSSCREETRRPDEETESDGRLRDFALGPGAQSENEELVQKHMTGEQPTEEPEGEGPSALTRRSSGDRPYLERGLTVVAETA